MRALERERVLRDLQPIVRDEAMSCYVAMERSELKGIQTLNLTLALTLSTNLIRY